MAAKKRILAIDDELMLLEIVQKMLTPDYEVSVVSSASDALHFLNTNTVDLILLDILMPNISGFDFLYDIRRIPSYMSVPIIIVSGKTGDDFLAEAKKSSAADVIAKPIRKEILIESIEKALSIKA